jgi:hypothetical protein
LDDYKDAASAWKVNLDVPYISTYLAAKATYTNANAATQAATRVGNGSSFAPVTYGKIAKNAALSTGSAYTAGGPKSNPMAGQFEYSKWANAAGGDYITIPFEVRLLNSAGEGVAADVYLTDLTLQKDESAANDLSSALRVHFASTTNQLWSKTGTDVVTSANLDLDGDGENDKVRTDRYNSFTNGALTDGIYGDYKTVSEAHAVDPEAVAASYAANAKNAATSPMANDSTDQLNKTNAIALGTTAADGGKLAITVTMWLEGWALLGDVSGTGTSAVWNTKYGGQKFNVGMTFAVDKAAA